MGVTRQRRCGCSNAAPGAAPHAREAPASTVAVRGSAESQPLPPPFMRQSAQSPAAELAAGLASMSMGRRGVAMVVLATALVLAITVVLVPQAISKSARNGGDPKQADPVPSLRASASVQEVLFLDEMQAHHKQAVYIANLVLSRAPGTSIAVVAGAIAKAESDELHTIDAWIMSNALDMRFGTSPNGIATGAQLSSLRAARGGRFASQAAALLLSNQRASAFLASLSSEAPNLQVAQLARTIAARQAAIVTQLQVWVGAH